MTESTETAYPVSIEEMSSRYKKIYTGVIADTLDAKGYRNQVLPWYINPVSDYEPIAGPAFTGIGEGHDNPEEDDARIRLDMLEQLTPGCISVWQTCGHFAAAHWGELMSVTAVQKGCKGVVLEGGTRDLQLIKEIGFPVYCRFTNPASSIGRWSIRAYQVPIKIGDTDINPGDFIIADIDGVVVVPKQIAWDILTEAEATVSKESKMRAELREGKSIIEVFDTYGVF